MNPNTSLPLVRELMTEFASQTGLSPPGSTPRRYLWTDAFAVCNFLELHRQTRENPYQQLALQLVEQVHHILGRHRSDDVRTGWISGLNEQEGEKHPTKGGLRIGKTTAERGPDDPVDESLEWDRDGQYFHYLTKWMHALNRVSQATADLTFNRWAIELAQTAHAKFTYVPPFGGQKHMYWKMSVDLSRPLVPSMGQHDPLDGLITYYELQLAAAEDAAPLSHPNLKDEINDMIAICQGKSWVTDDPLGIGGLLCDACKVAQMMVTSEFDQPDLLASLLDTALLGLDGFARTNPLAYPLEYRLAFRELGLTIGLHAVERLQEIIAANPHHFNKRLAGYQRVEGLLQYMPLQEAIEHFWLEPSHREATSWLEHAEINTVMLATSLAPDGFLKL